MAPVSVRPVSVAALGQFARALPGSDPFPQMTNTARFGDSARQLARTSPGPRRGTRSGLVPVAFKNARREYFLGLRIMASLPGLAPSAGRRVIGPEPAPSP